MTNYPRCKKCGKQAAYVDKKKICGCKPMTKQIQTNQEEMQSCLGCHGLTKKNEIHAECWNCGGDGYVESDDWQDWDHPYKKCYECLGKGYILLHTFYCSDECYAVCSPD